MRLKKTMEGRWARAGEDFRVGDLLTILDEGKEIEGEWGKRSVFKIRTPKGEEKNLTFNKISCNRLIDVYGEDTAQWVGKRVKVWIERQIVGGSPKRVVYLTAPNQALWPEETEIAEVDSEELPEGWDELEEK